jgi:hypothetical protein
VSLKTILATEQDPVSEKTNKQAKTQEQKQFKKPHYKLGQVAHAGNPSTSEAVTGEL